jgi:hypothetical protein
MRKNYAALLLCLFAVGFSFADTGVGSVDEKLREGIKLHDASRLDPANIEKGKAILESIQKDSPVAMAYYGSIITIEAGQYAKNKNGIKALELLGKGTGIIDKAVASTPNLPDLRFLRMENSYEVSIGSPVNRFKIMKTDIDWLDARKKDFTPALQGTIELYKGLYLVKSRKLEEGLSAFSACIAISPGSPEAIEAKKQIDRYAE